MGRDSTYDRFVKDKALETIVGHEVIFVNEDMQRGIDLEDEAVLMYELETGNTVSHDGFIFHGEGAGFSPDGFCEHNTIEVKCPRPNTHLKYINMDSLRKENYRYWYQCQMSMHIIGRDHCDFISYSEQDLFVYEVNALDSFGDEFEQKLERFIVDRNKAIDNYLEMFDIELWKKLLRDGTDEVLTRPISMESFRIVAT